MQGGTVLTADQVGEVAEVAKDHNIPLHIDGARIFNAATALSCSVDKLAQPADSIMFVSPRV